MKAKSINILKRLFPFAVTIVIFYFIFRSVDFEKFAESVGNINFMWLGIALAYFLIYPLVGIERWRQMINLKHNMTFMQATRIYFIGETLNIMLPSKAGDLSKAWFLKQFGISGFSYGTSSVIFEKLLDLISLGLAFVVGVLLMSGAAEYEVSLLFVIALFVAVFLVLLFLDKFVFVRSILEKIGVQTLLKFYDGIIEFVKLMRNNRIKLLIFIATSFAFWLGHLFHIWIFFKSANVFFTFQEGVFYIPIAIFVGLIPVTIGGMGTRDAAFITLLAAFAPTENIVLGGLMVSLRYFVPGLFGLFFIGDALKYKSAVEHQKVEALE